MKKKKLKVGFETENRGKKVKLYKFKRQTKTLLRMPNKMDGDEI